MGLPCDCMLRVPACRRLLLVRCHVLSLWKQLTKASSPIPEITDADMAFQAEETHSGSDDTPFRKQYRLFHAAFAQFCYTG
jgi:hypothetical protein